MASKLLRRNDFKAHTAKIMLLVVLTFIFFMPLISAFEFDNKITYESEDMKVKVTNSFGFGADLGTLELKSHKSATEVKIVGYGKEEVVMYYDFKNWNKYSNGLGEVYFTDMKTGEQIEKDYYFVEWVSEIVDVPNYKEVIVGTMNNGTKIYDYVQDGTKKELKEYWKKLDTKDITNKNVRIGLMTYVSKGDYLDAVWTIAGKKISKHASWATDSDLGLGLMAYYSLDEGTGSTNFQNNATPWDNNGTGGYAGISGATGKLGNSASFNNNASSKINVSNFVRPTNAITISAWVNVTEYVTDGIIVGGDDVNLGNEQRSFYFGLTSSKFLSMCISGENCATSNGGFVLNSSFVHVVGVYNGTDAWVYINGVENKTASGIPSMNSGTGIAIGQFSDEYIRGYRGFIDEVGIWNRSLSQSEIDSLYNVGNGLEYGEDPIISPTITIHSPEDNANFTLTNQVIMNATIFDDVSVTNVTLYLDGVGNETNLTSGVNNSVYTFTKDVAQGDTNWIIEACDDESNCKNTSSRLFSVDTIIPSVDVFSPTANIAFHENKTNLYLNWSANDTNLDSCIYNYNTTNMSVTCSDNQTTINITDYTNTGLTFWVSDTIGNVNTTIISWEYRLFKVSETFVSSVTEGSSNAFTINLLTNGSDITLANLSYDNQQNIGTILEGTTDNFTITKSVTVPSVTSSTNKSFFWNITQGTFNYALVSQNQTVNDTSIDNCADNTIVLYNFTIVDEESQVKINGNVQNTTGRINLQLYSLGRTTSLTNYSVLFNATNPFYVCLNSTISASESFNADVQVEYDSNGTVSELYHIQNATLNSTSINTNITLYDLADASSQVFKLIVKDSSFLALSDALIEVQRKYVDEDTFKIVELPKTDGTGKTVAHLVVNDAIYNFIVKKYGVTILTLSNVIPVCQTPLVTTCTIDFNAISSGIVVPDYEEGEDFNYTLGYDSATRTVTSEFTIPSEKVATVLLNVTKYDALRTSGCTKTVTSNLGTLSCVVPNSFGNETIIATITKDGVYVAGGTIKLDQSPSDIYGTSVVFLGLFIMLTLIGASISDNPVFTIIFLMVGVILLFALNLVANNGLIGGTATVLFLVIAIILVIIKGGRRN